MAKFLSARKGTRPSWGWQSLMLGRDSIALDVRWSIGNEKSINKWEDTWSSVEVLGWLAKQGVPQWVEELINHNEIVGNKQLLNDLFDEPIMEEIMAIPLSRNIRVDRLVWTVHKAGSFTVKVRTTSYNPQPSIRALINHHPPINHLEPDAKAW